MKIQIKPSSEENAEKICIGLTSSGYWARIIRKNMGGIKYSILVEVEIPEEEAV